MPFSLNRKNNLAYHRRKGSSKSKFKDSSSIFRRDSEKSKKRASTIFLRSKVLLTPAAQGLILEVPRIFLLMLLRFIDGTAENSGQRLDNDNRTHLGLVGGKLVLQK